MLFHFSVAKNISSSRFTYTNLNAPLQKWLMITASSSSWRSSITKDLYYSCPTSSKTNRSFSSPGRHSFLRTFLPKLSFQMSLTIFDSSRLCSTHKKIFNCPLTHSYKKPSRPLGEFTRSIFGPSCTLYLIARRTHFSYKSIVPIHWLKMTNHFCHFSCTCRSIFFRVYRPSSYRFIRSNINTAAKSNSSRQRPSSQVSRGGRSFSLMRMNFSTPCSGCCFSYQTGTCSPITWTLWSKCLRGLTGKITKRSAAI